MTDKEIMDRLSNLENLVARFIDSQDRKQKAQPRGEIRQMSQWEQEQRHKAWKAEKKREWEQQQQHKEEEDVCGDIINFLSNRVNNMGCQKGFRELTQLYIQAVIALRNQCKGVNNAERKTN